jgi:CubicO group peptidase (beta-lactamase class C family)
VRTYYLATVLILCSISGCGRRGTQETRELAGIAGCWKGGEVSGVARPPSELRFFSWRPDSSLSLSLTYEIGPRSRVRTSDIEVTASGGIVRWDGHEGFLSEDKDTLTVLERKREGKSLWRFVRHAPADSLMAQLYTYAGRDFVYSIPDSRGDGWDCAHMARCGIDTARIIEFIDHIVRGKHDDIHSVLVVKDATLIVEEYFADNGTKHGPFITGLFRNRVHHLASTTKSVTSLLVGIAIDQGFITGAQDPIYRYLPTYLPLFTDDKRRITIGHMLTMTPGFAWRQVGVSDDRNDGMLMWNAGDVISFVLEKPLEAAPGKKFNYTNGVPTVTGAVLKNAVGREVAEFAEKYLFQPLGISEYVWTSYPDGSIETDGGLALRPRDLAKIGQLYLNGGLWNGQRVVSKKWIRESTKERLTFGEASRWGYGYYWTRAQLHISDRVVELFCVPGDGNQILAVFPELNMVVVFTAGNYGRDPKPVYAELFEKYLLPAVISDENEGG